MMVWFGTGKRVRMARQAVGDSHASRPACVEQQLQRQHQQESAPLSGTQHPPPHGLIASNGGHCFPASASASERAPHLVQHLPHVALHAVLLLQPAADAPHEGCAAHTRCDSRGRRQGSWGAGEMGRAGEADAPHQGGTAHALHSWHVPGESEVGLQPSPLPAHVSRSNRAPSQSKAHSHPSCSSSPPVAELLTRLARRPPKVAALADVVKGLERLAHVAVNVDGDDL